MADDIATIITEENKPNLDGFLNQINRVLIKIDQDVTSFSIGDYIKIEKRFYKIFEPPLKDSSGKILKIEAIESV